MLVEGGVVGGGGGGSYTEGVGNKLGYSCQQLELVAC